MNDNWRLAQVFLDARVPRVYEVEIHQDVKNKVRCSCMQFKDNKRCMHTKYVQQKTNNYNGHYPIQLSNNIPDSLIIDVFDDKEEFRNFVIKYAKIEVM
jgi:hypothetical protein